MDQGYIPELLAFAYDSPEARREPPCDSRLLPAIRVIGHVDNVELIMSLGTRPAGGQTKCFRVVTTEKVAIEVWLLLDTRFHVFEVYRRDFREPQAELAKRIDEGLNAWYEWRRRTEEATRMSRGIPEPFRHAIEAFHQELRGNDLITSLARIGEGPIEREAETLWHDPLSLDVHGSRVDCRVYCDGFSKTFRLLPKTVRAETLMARIETTVQDLWQQSKEKAMPSAPTQDPILVWLRRFGQADIRTIREGEVSAPDPPTVTMGSGSVEVCCNNGRGVSVVTVRPQDRNTSTKDLLDLIATSITQQEYPKPATGAPAPQGASGHSSSAIETPSPNSQLEEFKRGLNDDHQLCLEWLLAYGNGASTFRVTRLWGGLVDQLMKSRHLPKATAQNRVTGFMNKLRACSAIRSEGVGRGGKARDTEVHLHMLTGVRSNRAITPDTTPASRPAEDSVDTPAYSAPKMPDPNSDTSTGELQAAVEEDGAAHPSADKQTQPLTEMLMVPPSVESSDLESEPRTTEEICGMIQILVTMLHERGYSRVALSEEGTLQFERRLQP